MSLAYTAPTWTDGSGEGISASNLQAISNCIEGLVQGSDKAVHGVSINGSVITLTYADGTSENFTAVDIKGISSVAKTGTSGLVDTYTITYSDGTTGTFTVTNGADGQNGRDGAIQYTAGTGISISDENVISATGGGGGGDMSASTYDPQGAVATAGGIPAYVSSAISGKADDSDLDGWTSAVTASTVGSDVVAVFDDLDNSYGYDLYCVDELIGIKSMTKGTGTNTGIKLTFVLDGATSGVTSCKLRILK